MGVTKVYTSHEGVKRDVTSEASISLANKSGRVRYGIPEVTEYTFQTYDDLFELLIATEKWFEAGPTLTYETIMRKTMVDDILPLLEKHEISGSSIDEAISRFLLGKVTEDNGLKMEDGAVDVVSLSARFPIALSTTRNGATHILWCHLAPNVKSCGDTVLFSDAQVSKLAPFFRSGVLPCPLWFTEELMASTVFPRVFREVQQSWFMSESLQSLEVSDGVFGEKLICRREATCGFVRFLSTSLWYHQDGTPYRVLLSKNSAREWQIVALEPPRDDVEDDLVLENHVPRKHSVLYVSYSFPIPPFEGWVPREADPCMGFPKLSSYTFGT